MTFYRDQVIIALTRPCIQWSQALNLNNWLWINDNDITTVSLMTTFPPDLVPARDCALWECEHPRHGPELAGRDRLLRPDRSLQARPAGPQCGESRPQRHPGQQQPGLQGRRGGARHTQPARPSGQECFDTELCVRFMLRNCLWDCMSHAQLESQEVSFSLYLTFSAPGHAGHRRAGQVLCDHLRVPVLPPAQGWGQLTLALPEAQGDQGQLLDLIHRLILGL